MKCSYDEMLDFRKTLSTKQLVDRVIELLLQIKSD